MDIHEFEARAGLKFTHPALLQQALTHRSYVNEHPQEADLVDNERLEFLGDAVLGFLTAELLFRRFPALPEGDLTRLRAALVRNESLARLASEIELGAALRMGRGEESTGGRARVNNLGSGFEALIGALFLDQGLEGVRLFVMPRLLLALDRVITEQLDKDARSLLQEWAQANHNLTPQYRTITETGPEHEKVFTVEVLLGDQVIGSGSGRSKQAASKAAARAALDSAAAADKEV